MNLASKKQMKTNSVSPAWQRAEDYGIDISLLTANLRLSIAERLRRHDADLQTIALL